MSQPSPRSTPGTAALMLLSGLLFACGRGGPVEGHTAGDGGMAGTTTGDDTGTGGTTGGTTTAELGIAGIRGEASISGPIYDGAEETYFEHAKEGTSWCSVVSDVIGSPPAVPCDGCEWSFTLETSGSVASGNCSDIDASAFDGASFSYGYFVDGYGYGVMAYYYDGYGWYGTYATATLSKTGTFNYDWPQYYFYY